MLQQLSKDPNADIGTVLDTPRPSDDIISVCDHLISSLAQAEENAKTLLDMLQKMKVQFS